MRLVREKVRGPVTTITCGPHVTTSPQAPSSAGSACYFPVGLVAGILVWGPGVCLFFVLPVVVLSLRWKLNTENSYRKGGSDVSWDGSQVGPVWMVQEGGQGRVPVLPRKY